MTRTTRLLLGLPLVALAAACSSDGAKTSSDPTFTQIKTDVLTLKSCGGPLCHTYTAGGFQITGVDLYKELVDADASGALCGTSGLKRVVPGDPDASLLYLKISGHAPCGDDMPSSGTPLTQDKIALVKKWIEAGAPND